MTGSRLFLAGLAGLALLASTPAFAAQLPRAQVRGDLPADLRARIEAAVGATDRPVRNRFDARQRANAAAEEATAVLRSEGFYGASVSAGVSEQAEGGPFIEVRTGPRFKVADPRIEWIEPEPVAAIQALGRGELKLEPGQPARAIDVVSAEARVLSAIPARSSSTMPTRP